MLSVNMQRENGRDGVNAKFCGCSLSSSGRFPSCTSLSVPGVECCGQINWRCPWKDRGP